MLANHVKLNTAMRRLWASVEGHSHFGFVNHVVGISIRVGIRIFSIVAGSGFGGGLSRVFVQQRLEGQDLRLLHKLRRPEEAWGPRRSLSSLIVGFRETGQ